MPFATHRRRLVPLAAAAAVLMLAGLMFVSWQPAPGTTRSRTVPGPLDVLNRTPGAESDAAQGPEDAYLYQRFTAFGIGAHRGVVDARDFALAASQARTIRQRTAASLPRLAAQQWQFVGPSNIGGRVVDMAIDPNTAGTVYIATATGGVWKTTDAGDTFVPAWPSDYAQSIGAIAEAPDGTLYVGTGETNPGGGSITYGGSGIYRSTNGGATWRHMGLSNSFTIARIMVDPGTPSRIYAAVSGNLFNRGGQRGLYVSNDRGGHWRLMLRPPNGTTGADDLQIDPKDPKRIFVAMWDHQRFPDYRRYAGVGSSIWRSVDGGATWTELGPANGLLPDNKANGRIGLGVDPSNPNNVYAIYANNTEGAFEAFYKSTDGGDTWTANPTTQASLADSQSVYGWWFARIWIDPSDSNHVFLAGLPLEESTDGGVTFTAQNEPHADQHALAFDPHQAHRVYLGDDGGFYRSDSNGADNTWVKATYEPWSQYSDVEVSNQDPSRISGGLQDNGSIRSWGGSNWNNYYGGDGQRNLINPSDQQNVFACYQYGSCARSDDGGNTMNEFDQTTVSDRHNYFTPMEFDPSDPDIVYYAGDIVNRSTDRGNTWTPISTDLGKGNAGRETNPLYAGHYGTVTSLAVAATNPAVIWAGTDDHYLWKTKDTGGTWRQIHNPHLPQRWVSHVTIDPTLARVVYVTYSGYRSGVEDPYVFRTKDGGITWTNISANLPGAPVTDLVVVGSNLYVSTDVGVFTTNASTINWASVGSGLPNVPVTWLRYETANHTLYAATFGRGVWSIPLT